MHAICYICITALILSGEIYFCIKPTMNTKSMTKTSVKSTVNATEYSELDEITHTIECPDVYMGALKNNTKELYTYNPDTNEVKLESVNYNTGLLKIFDEIITNASDNLQRQDSGISQINVNITDDYISINNNGRTIPIEQNENGIYIPEMIFTHFRSGSNFRKRNKTTGGKNGIGAKLTGVYSSKFIIDIKIGKQTYHQEVSNNLRNIKPPVIKGEKEDNVSTNKQSITITFYPDFKLLKMNENKITNGNKKVLFKRCHDMCHLPLLITVNEKQLPRLGWIEYANSFNISNQLFTHCNDRWKVAFGLCNQDKFKQISYVNNIATYEGGEHVKYILDQIYKYIVNNTDDSDIAKVSKASFKSKICIIVYSIIDDPSFTSQAKETLSTPSKEFGTTCNISESTLSNFMNNTNILELLKPQQKKPKLTKQKKGKLTSIEKLVEANRAGTSEGYKCTLFLCEGLSAKNMCDTGIGILGHNYYGCYPLRGKCLNTRNATEKQYQNNRELTDVKNIIGLVDDYEYKPEDIKTLRYGKVVCVKDADSDGASIMGLIINFFETKFPTLITIPGFFSEFISPMIKVVYNANDKRKRRVVPFYNEVEYRQFIESQTPQSTAYKQFTVEFIKGLATNEAQDVKEYFTHYNDNLIQINFNGKYRNWLDMAFNDRKADLRKDWLQTITPDTHLPRVKGQPIELIDFVKNDLVLFSYDNCVRSIPSVIDGLKPTQRKILYTMFSMGKKAYNKMKVFQWGGKIADFANYHHGEQSMYATIIGMAQDFTGSGNNIPLLKPSGAFGSRTEFGEDAGAPRYISCSLNKITRILFPPDDDTLMEVKEEDNVKVEPFYYAPIIPVILVNGAKGIGTGWSTEIPSFNPIDVINYVRWMLTKDGAKSKKPKIRSWYDKFVGDIDEEDDGWTYYGRVKGVNSSSKKQKVYVVDELPIRYTTSKFIDRLNYLAALGEAEYKISNSKSQDKKLEEIEANGKRLKVCWLPAPPIESFENNCAVEKINFKITFCEPIAAETVMNALRLKLTIKNTNMVAFNAENRIQRYNSIEEIVDEWFDIRYETYVKRQEKIINELEYQLMLISNKCRFIAENIEQIIDVKNKPKAVIVKVLEQRKYDKVYEKNVKSKKSSEENEDENDEDENDEDEEEKVNDVKGNYDYLLNMKIYTLTKEKFDELKRKQGQIQKQLEDYKALTVEDIWLEELDQLEEAYIELNSE